MARLTSLNAISAQEHLRDQVAHALRAALIAGELRPGTIYSAPALAAEFGVSATPVREAMLDLAREGLVEAVRNKGFRITELTDQDLDDFTELRAMIEVPTVGRIARMGLTVELEALRPVAKEIVEAARHDILGYLEADRRFHLALLGLAGNHAAGGGGRRTAQALPPVRAQQAGRVGSVDRLRGGARTAAGSGHRRGRPWRRGLHARPHVPCPVPVGRRHAGLTPPNLHRSLTSV